MELSKFIKSESVEMLRSEIKLADYNPRAITDEAKKALKRSIKKFGLVGGMVVNKQTNTLTGGHQKVQIIDELQKYNPETKENDYKLRVELIDVDEKTEKELCVVLNNPNAQGYWDYDKLRALIPDIDYKDAGLTEADLSMIGVDFLLQTEEENNLANELDELMQPIRDEREEEKKVREEIRKNQEEAEALAKKERKVVSQLCAQKADDEPGNTEFRI